MATSNFCTALPRSTTGLTTAGTSLFIALLLAFTPYEAVQGHSFLVCTDLRPDGSCQGYPRNFKAFTVVQDGYTYRPGRTGVACDPDKQSRSGSAGSSYSSTFPMAKANPGDSLTLQWPARNHAPANLPGRTVQVYWEPKPSVASDPSQSELENNLLAELPFGDYGNGQSACAPGTPNDRLCSGSFKIPGSAAPGVYTMQWWWEFNPGEFYATCFEVNVGNVDVGNPDDGEETPTVSPSSSFPTAVPTNSTDGPTVSPSSAFPTAVPTNSTDSNASSLQLNLQKTAESDDDEDVVVDCGASRRLRRSLKKLQY